MRSCGEEEASSSRTPVDASEAELLETWGAPIEALFSDGEDSEMEIWIRVNNEREQLDPPPTHIDKSQVYVSWSILLLFLKHTACLFRLSSPVYFLMRSKTRTT